MMLEWCLICQTLASHCDEAKHQAHPPSEILFDGTVWAENKVDMAGLYPANMPLENFPDIRLTCPSCGLNYLLDILNMPIKSVLRIMCPWCRVAYLIPTFR